MAGDGFAVDARGVSKWFAGAAALDGVELAVPAGTVHGLLGPNGAGKTTLLSILFGLVRPDEGDIRLLGRSRHQAGRGWLDGVGGFVEAPRFYPHLTGRQNLRVLARLDGSVYRGLVDGMLELVGLPVGGQLKVRGYSLGMRQRLGLAAALIRRPRLLILDEPWNGLDPAGIRDLGGAVRRLAQDGLAVLVSSHDITHVNEICDGVTILSSGQVRFAGTLEQLRAAAPEPIWRLETSDAGAASAVAADLADLADPADPADPAGLTVDVLDGGVLRVTADQSRLDDFVIGLGRAGVAVRALAQQASSLESLFFRLTEDDSDKDDPARGSDQAGSDQAGSDQAGTERGGTDRGASEQESAAARASRRP